MFASKITLRSSAYTNPTFFGALESPYSLHQSIWKLFDNTLDRARDYLYRVDRVPGGLVVHSVSQRPPVMAGNGIWDIQTKPFNPVITKGMDLIFSLRANPARNKEEDGKVVRQDVVMEAVAAARERIGGRFLSKEVLTAIRDKKGRRWLREQGSHNGFTLVEDMCSIDNYWTERFQKKRGNHLITMRLMDFRGVLVVDDPGLFVEMLAKGIGKSRGFGCGLMLIAKPWGQVA
jgi:CRISPR system Cascade subunit CasE